MVESTAIFRGAVTVLSSPFIMSGLHSSLAPWTVKGSSRAAPLVCQKTAGAKHGSLGKAMSKRAAICSSWHPRLLGRGMLATGSFWLHLRYLSAKLLFTLNPRPPCPMPTPSQPPIFTWFCTQHILPNQLWCRPDEAYSRKRL